ncbi:MAG: hypothetical protein NTW26_11635 [bacterium]|nr:hypothetical protein [bacterium]
MRRITVVIGLLVLALGAFGEWRRSRAARPGRGQRGSGRAPAGAPVATNPALGYI